MAHSQKPTASTRTWTRSTDSISNIDIPYTKHASKQLFHSKLSAANRLQCKLKIGNENFLNKNFMETIISVDDRKEIDHIPGPADRIFPFMKRMLKDLVWLVWLVGFYGISTFVCYLTPNPFSCKPVLLKTIQFNCQKHIYFKLFKQLYVTIRLSVNTVLMSKSSSISNNLVKYTQAV